MADLAARAGLAAYKVKSEIEWDMRWAGHPLDRTKKDELLIFFMALPILGSFIPGVKEYVIGGLEVLKVFHADAPQYFLYGWAIIFAATFGVKQALGFVLPNRHASLVSAMGAVKDDVPMGAVETAQDAVTVETEKEIIK
jgi:hypothetical protein